MNRYRIVIQGRPYFLATEEKEDFAGKLESRINEDLEKIKAELPSGDFIDAFVTYIFRIFEKLEMQEQELKKIKTMNDAACKKLNLLRKEVETRLGRKA